MFEVARTLSEPLPKGGTASVTWAHCAFTNVATVTVHVCFCDATWSRHQLCSLQRDPQRCQPTAHSHTMIELPRQGGHGDMGALFPDLGCCRERTACYARATPTQTEGTTTPSCNKFPYCLAFKGLTFNGPSWPYSGLCRRALRQLACDSDADLIQAVPNSFFLVSGLAYGIPCR